MARWSATNTNWTPTAVGDALAFTSGGFFALQGGSSTQRLQVTEVKIGGLATSSAPSQLMLARDSTVGGTLSGGNLAALDPSSAALAAPPVQFNTATTKPQRSSTLQILPLGLNTYGGVIRWAVPLSEGVGLLGNTASLGELSISHLLNGTPGLMDSAIIFEPL